MVLHLSGWPLAPCCKPWSALGKLGKLCQYIFGMHSGKVCYLYYSAELTFWHQAHSSLECLPLQIQSRHGCLDSDFIDPPSFADISHEMYMSSCVSSICPSKVVFDMTAFFNKPITSLFIGSFHERTKGKWSSDVKALGCNRERKPTQKPSPRDQVKIHQLAL